MSMFHTLLVVQPVENAPPGVFARVGFGEACCVNVV